MTCVEYSKQSDSNLHDIAEQDLGRWYRRFEDFMYLIEGKSEQLFKLPSYESAKSSALRGCNI